MRNFKLQILALFTITLMSLSFFSCSDTDDTAQGTSKLMVAMSDAPGDYDAVNIEVLDVMIKNSSDTGDQGWVSVGKKGQVGAGKIYDLLKLTGGANAILTDSLIPSGHLGQIRLLLGTQNTVVVGGTSYPLDTPSAQQSGLKLLVNQTLTPNITYNFLLDFDVDKSIVASGSAGKYSLKPVIRVSTSAATGIIKGSISPAVTYKVLASVTVAGNEITAYANDQGVFQLNGVPAGTYDVTLTPATTSGVSPKTITGVVVVNGQTTTMAAVSLP